jgi:putative peptidoglycan lipid II flippase
MTVTGRGAHSRQGRQGRQSEPSRRGRTNAGRSTVSVAIGTFLSRLTGAGRVLAIAYVLGINHSGDAYNLANTMPNLLYDLVLGGVLSATLIPVFVARLAEEDQDDAWRAISAVITLAGLVLAIASVAVWLAAPAIIHLFAMRIRDPATRAAEAPLAATWLRMFAPQVFLLGIITLTQAVLNARRHFSWPAFSPIFNNLWTTAVIVATGVVAHDVTLTGLRHNTTAVWLLGAGTTAGYAVQAALQFPPLRWRSVRARLRVVWDPGHPAVRQLARLSGWVVGVVVANQLAFLVAQYLAVPVNGGITAYQLANLFFQLPNAVIATSVLAVITPDLAEQWTRGDLASFRATLVRSFRVVTVALVPAAVVYLSLARPLMAVLLRHGVSTVQGSNLTAGALIGFAVGMPGYFAFMLITRAYLAMQDTRTVFILYAIENALNIVLALALFPSMHITGLTLAFSLSYGVGAAIGLSDLRRRTAGLELRELGLTVGRTLLACAVMAVAVIGVDHVLRGPGAREVLGVAVSLAVGGVAYLVMLRLLGADEMSMLQHLRPGRSETGR